MGISGLIRFESRPVEEEEGQCKGREIQVFNKIMWVLVCKQSCMKITGGLEEKASGLVPTPVYRRELGAREEKIVQ